MVLLYSAGGRQALSFASFLSFDIALGPALLFGISSLTFPAWDQQNEVAQSDARPDRLAAIGTRPTANSPHPSSREGHLSALAEL